MKQQFKFLLALAVIFLLGARASAADIARAEILSSTCFGCHGSNGVSVSDGMPSIAGLDKRYFMRVMRRFQNGERASTIMGRLAKGYERAQLRMMATYYAEQPWVSASADVSPVKVAKGQKLHEELCETCHEQQGRFQDKEVPRLAGQWPKYLYVQLLDYRDRPSQMPQPAKMERRVKDLTDDELDALSHFYASQL